MVEARSSQIQYDRFGTAAENGDFQTIQSMLTGENPVPVDCLCRVVSIDLFEGECLAKTALVRTCQGGHFDIVQELLRAGADVNWKHERVTPLYAACEYGNSPEVVEALLAAGADVNATVHDYYCDYEYNPLMSVASSEGRINSRIEIARLLLAANCDINQETKDGHTALALACIRCHDKLVRWLLEHGARVTRKAWFKCFNYCTPYDDDANASTFIKTVSCLLKHGMDVNATDANGRTAIHWAAEKHNTNLVRLLMDHNADVSIQDGSGRTALMEACLQILRDNEIQIIRMLSDRMNTVDKKLIDLPDSFGYTALHFAARSNSWRVIHELLNWEPNLLCQTGDTSITALHSCVLYWWCKESIRLSNLRCMVEHANGYGLDGINIQDERGRTVLHLALEDVGSNKSVIDYLSTKVDVSIQDVEGNTPLHIAVKCDHAESTVQMMLRSPHGTEAANTRNALGWTPLHEAAFLSNANLVHAIGQIADVNIPCHGGKTALHYAVTKRATSCLEMLLMLNANVSVRDHDGNTALMLACNSCYDDDDENQAQLTMIFELYKRGVAYGEV